MIFLKHSNICRVGLTGLVIYLCSTSALFAADTDASNAQQKLDEQSQSESRSKSIGEHFSNLNPFKKKEAVEDGEALFENQDPLDRDTSGQIDKKHEVVDIAYGEILMQYFNNNNSEALLRTRIAQSKNELKENSEHADLLLAQLYILEGLPEQAQAVLERIAKNRVSQETRTAALFQLVRIHTYQGDLEKAKQILETGFGPLEGHQELDRKVLLANIYALQKNKEAVQHTLIGVKPEITRNAYIKYNLASAGLFSDQAEFALPIMLELTQGEHNDLESRTLKDFANLSVGLYHLKQDELDEAKQYFKNVSYIGPHSSAALYYIAWIELKHEDYQTAFAYWVDLSKRNPIDPYVGKSYLLRPYTLEKLNSTHSALSGYLRSSELYGHLISDTEKTIEIVNSPSWLQKLHPGSLETTSMYEKIAPQPGWVETQTNEINFLIDLYSSDKFAILHQNFWELELLKQKLESSKKKFEVFQLQKQTHDEKYERLGPEAKEKINSRQLHLIQARLDDITQEIQNISSGDNVFAAPNEKQLRILNRIKFARSILENEPESAYPSQRKLLSRLEAVNAWEMNQDAPVRQWQIKQQYKELIELLKQTQKHREQIEQGIQQTDYYARLVPKLNALSAELEIRVKQLELLSLKHQKLLRTKALEILEKRKKEYKALNIRAKLAAARLQDSMVTGGNK